MPSTRPTVDPVLDILEEMGYDFDELEGDGYKRSIREALFKTHPDTGGKTADPEKFKILNDEFKKVRRGGDKPLGVEAKEKKTTIKASKLLPGRGKFNPNDIGSEESEAKVGENVGKNKFVDFLNSEVKSRLDNINSSLGNILKLLKDREAAAEARDDDMREAINASKKSSREDKLEGKKGFKDKFKDKVMGQVEKTAGNFFMKVLKFALFTWLGSSLSRLITIIKDPAVLLDPIKKFFNAFIAFKNFIMKAMWSITGKPINDIIKGIEDGTNFVIDSINKATSLLFIPPIPSVKLPKIPGPFQIPLIPLSKTAQAASGGGIDTKGTPLQGASEGGIVAGKDGVDGVDGLDAVQGRDGPTKDEMKGKKKDTSKMFGSDSRDVSQSVTVQGANTGGQVGAPGMEGGSGFNFLNPMSWIGGQAQGAIGQADRGEGEVGGGLAGQMMEKRRALAEAQGLSGGGTVDAKNISAAGGGKVESNSGIKIKGMGADTQLLAAKPGESVLQPGVREQILKDTGTDVLAYNKGPNANRPTVSNTNNITAASTGGTVTTISNRDRSNRITAASTGGIVKDRTSITPKVTRMNVGGLVPAPYPEGDNILNSFPMMMGYRGGGDVVDAKLTPGEIVMNKEQQKKMLQRTGVDPASFVPPAQPGKVKFGTGGRVAPGADVNPPGSSRGGVNVINVGNKTPSPSPSGGSGGGDIVPNIRSTDSNNMLIPVVKSIYNIMG